METDNWHVVSEVQDDKVMTNNNPIPGLVSLEETIVLEQYEPTKGKAEDKRGRRKSWHIKMERKRRKGVISATTATPVTGSLPERHKRPSWWNIFVPDHWPSRSRRASQDISRSTDNIVPWPRSKSRSVDHGFSPPFDLDSLRSKVEGRFESVDKLSRGDSDGGGSKEGAALTEKKMAKNLPPENTTTYTVEASDTLTSVAARFDTTPSELTKLNRLNTRLVFPGQLLYVPNKGGMAGDRQDEEGGSQVSTPTATTHPEDDVPLADGEKDILDNLRPVSPKLLPGHIERVQTPSSPKAISSSAGPDGEHEELRTEKKAYERFLKINVRHITDGQGVVAGVLLVTPNAVMFDPNVSDPLVIEHGPESYGVIAPMEFVVNAAIYYDIAHMRVGHSSDTPKSNVPKPEIYHAKGFMDALLCHNSPGKDSLLVKDETFPELAPVRSSPEEDNDSECSCTGREGDAFPKAFERDLVTPTNLQDEALEQLRSSEERRRSCLDHHWAIPSIDRLSEEEKDEEEDSGSLVKLSCHDSGIDIRDSDPAAAAAPIAPSAKKVFSDADIINASKLDWVPPLTTAAVEVEGQRKKTSSVSFSLDSNPELEGLPENKESFDEGPEKQESRKNKMLKRLSYPLAWMEGFTSDREDKDALPPVPTMADGQQHSSVFSKVFSRRSSVGTFIRQPQQPSEPRVPKLDYRSMVSVDDMPELFVSFDKLIPRPARSCEDPPLYLRLRMGKPLNKKIPKSTPIMSYGKKKMRPEYWFSVPRNRVDDLYNFLRAWVPHLYGELEDMDPTLRGYELVESDTELWEEEDSNGKTPERKGSTDEEGDLGDLTRESWEVLSMSEELRRALYANSVASLDLDFIPDLVGVTEILSEEHRKKLCRHLPARAEGYLWTLVFSTSQHGFSLNSMYRKMHRLESPVLMVIEDTEHNVFGALTSCAMKVSDHFYGTGESLLFRFTPEFQVFNWTGDNMYFIKGNNESLAIGAGDGKFGLWLDGDLYQGRTQPCNTYGNEPLAPQEDFVVKTLECWAFI